MAFASPKDCERIGKHWINLENNTCYRCGMKITSEKIEKSVEETPKIVEPEIVVENSKKEPKEEKQEEKPKVKIRVKKSK